MDLNDVIKVVDSHTDDMASISCRVGNIEVSNARVDNQMQNLIISVDKLADSIKLVFFGALGTLGGFLIWYIQQLK